MAKTPSFQPPLWRKFVGALFGLIVAVTVLMFLQRLGLSIWPLPDSIDYTDRARMAELIRSLPAASLLWVALSYFGGTLAGAFVALRFARDAVATWPALVVEAVLLAFGVINLMSLPHPVWFWIVSLASFPLGAFTAIGLARRFPPR